MKYFKHYSLALALCLSSASAGLSKEKAPTPPSGPVKFECPFKVGAVVLSWSDPKGGAPFGMLPSWSGPNDDDPVIYKWNDFNSKGEPVPPAFVKCYKEVEGKNNPYVELPLPDAVRYCQTEHAGKDHKSRFWCK